MKFSIQLMLLVSALFVCAIAFQAEAALFGSTIPECKYKSDPFQCSECCMSQGYASSYITTPKKRCACSGQSKAPSQSDADGFWNN